MNYNKIWLLMFFALAFGFSKGQTLNHYFGNIHAHSSYSDGNKSDKSKTPIDNYAYAKLALNFDFLGISEHNHKSAGMSSIADFHQGLLEANTANEDSSFVCLYGLEYGIIGTGGHVLIYGYDSLIGWENNLYDVYNDQADYLSLFTKIARNPNAFAYLAHPGGSDYNDLKSLPYSSTYDSAIVGLPHKSGPGLTDSDTYNSVTSTEFTGYYYKMLSLGYHLGIGMDHDNHYMTFGTLNQSRLVAVAPANTKYEILNALKNRSFYSSEDWNAKIDFTINNYQIGSITTDNVVPTINIIANDDDNESILSIIIMSGVPGSVSNPQQITSVSNSNTITYTDNNLNDLETKYYFAKITQTDGDVIYTSPIWFTRNDTLIKNDSVIAGINNNKISNLSIFPNPAHSYLTVSFKSVNFEMASLTIINTLGKKIKEEQIELVNGTYAQTIDLNGLPKGIYFLNVTAKTEQLTHKIVVE